MSLEFVPFEAIDKNKWNGTVHYAINTNIYGYHWYLRSVIKEWDALVEGDYLSVMPVPRNAYNSFQQQLIPDLGPYTVQQVTENRMQDFKEAFHKHAPKMEINVGHIFSSKIGKTADNVVVKNIKYLNTNSAFTSNPDVENFAFSNQEKPELFLKSSGLSKDEINTYYRLYYNAIQRGYGWHSKIINLENNQTADALILKDRNHIYITYLGKRNDPEAERFMIESLIKNNQGDINHIFLNVPTINKLAGFHLENFEIITIPPKESGMISSFMSFIDRFTKR